MKKLHKASALILGATMTLSLAAFADEDVVLISQPADDIEAEAVEMLTESFVLTTGTIDELSEDSSFVSIKTEDGIYEALVANVGPQTSYFKADGTPIGYADLKVGDSIAVYHSQMVTMSIPAQSPAYAVIVTEDGVATPKYMEIGEVTANEDGTYLVSSIDGLYEITLTAETEVTPYRTRNIVMAQDLKVGDEIAVWYDVATLSIPERATATKVMLVTPANAFLEAIEFEIVDVDGVSMVPLRAAATQYGAVVDWEEDTNTAVVTVDDKTLRFPIDSTTLKINDEDFEVSFSPVLYEDKTMLELELFQNLFETTVLF